MTLFLLTLQSFYPKPLCKHTDFIIVCFILFSIKSEFWITGQAFIHNHAAILFSFKDDIPISREKIINTEYRAKLLHEVSSRIELFLERRNVVEKLIFHNRKGKKKKKKVQAPPNYINV